LTTQLVFPVTYVTVAAGPFVGTLPLTVVRSIPSAWLTAPIRLHVAANNEEYYTFSAAASLTPSTLVQMGIAPAMTRSGGWPIYWRVNLQYLLFLLTESRYTSGSVFDE